MSLLKRRFDQLRHAWRNLSKHWLAVVASFLSLAAILASIDGNWLSAAICFVLSLAQWDAYWRERRSWAGRVHERWSRRDATIWWLALSIAVVLLVLSFTTALGSWALLGVSLISLGLGLLRDWAEGRHRGASPEASRRAGSPGS